MYEKYTYEQIKELPDELKTTVLKELKEKFPVNTDLAKHLNVAPIVTSNLMKKYVEGIQVGRKKMTEEEKAQAKAEREAKKLQEQTGTTQSTITNVVTNPESELKPEPVITPTNDPIQSTNSSFNITLDKDMVGEAATVILNGIAGTLLKDVKYQVTLNIEEV